MSRGFGVLEPGRGVWVLTELHPLADHVWYRHGQRLAALSEDPPARGSYRHHAARREIDAASLSGFAGNEQLFGLRGRHGLLDLIELGVDARQEFRARQECLDVESPEEHGGRTGGVTPCGRAPPLSTPLSASMISASPKPLCGTCGLPSGARDPPSKNSFGSVAARPAESKISPSGRSTPRSAASRTFCIEATVVAISSTTFLPRPGRQPDADRVRRPKSYAAARAPERQEVLGARERHQGGLGRQADLGTHTTSCQSLIDATAIPFALAGALDAPAHRLDGAPGPQPRSPSICMAPPVSRSTRTLG